MLLSDERKKLGSYTFFFLVFHDYEIIDRRSSLKGPLYEGKNLSSRYFHEKGPKKKKGTSSRCILRNEGKEIKKKNKRERDKKKNIIHASSIDLHPTLG